MCSRGRHEQKSIVIHIAIVIGKSGGKYDDYRSDLDIVYPFGILML